MKPPAHDSAGLTSEGEGFVTPEPRLHYLALPTPEPGASVEIAAGVHWLRMPLPVDLSHINLWLLEDAEGFTLVDTGMAVPLCAGVWEALEAGLLRRRPLRRILLTHFHPDHMGCAGWLQQRHRLPVRMAARAMPAARQMIAGPGPGERTAIAGYFAAHGMPAAAAFAERLFAPRAATPISRMPDINSPLLHGERLAVGDWNFEVIETEGHAVAHQSFYSAKPALLISGDQVLPTISPNISLPASHWGQDPLGGFLDSLDLLEALPEDTLVLPSHGRPFRGLRARTRDLRAHHHGHLELLRNSIATPRSAFELMPTLFGRRLSGLHCMLGLHECIAHLEHLVRRGQAAREGDADVGYHYRQTPA
jgi:glyoxylase-like metal-dependent hydrolase (beta-lactamase superfamily II)